MMSRFPKIDFPPIDCYKELHEVYTRLSFLTGILLFSTGGNHD